MCVCVSVRVCFCTYVCVGIYAGVYTCMCVCVWVFVYMCLCGGLCDCVLMCAWMYVGLCACCLCLVVGGVLPLEIVVYAASKIRLDIVELGDSLSIYMLSVNMITTTRYKIRYRR